MISRAPPVFASPERGGLQSIPRLPGVREGGRAPWAPIPARHRKLSLKTVVEAVDSNSRRSDSTAPTFTESAVCASFAVLVLLYEHDGEACVVLTRRASHLRRHAGEVAFPGGRREPGDVGLWATALREAEEETGLDPIGVRYVGWLDSFTTVTSPSQTRVCPFVATVDSRPRLRPAPDEVEAVLHVRLGELLADEAWREEIWVHCGSSDRVMTFFELPGDTVWGATAAVLRQLLEIAVASAFGWGEPESHRPESDRLSETSRRARMEY